jgi:hypothetical protein
MDGRAARIAIEIELPQDIRLTRRSSQELEDEVHAAAYGQPVAVAGQDIGETTKSSSESWIAIEGSITAGPDADDAVRLLERGLT